MGEAQRSNSSSPVAILGSGGHAHVVAEALLLSGGRVAGYVSPAAMPMLDVATCLIGDRLGDDTSIPGLLGMGHILALGLGFVDMAGAHRRAALLAHLPTSALAVICHPASIVSPYAELAPGTVVCAGAVVAVGARLGVGALVNSGAVVDHDTQLGPNTHVATGARLAGGITVGKDVLIGVGAMIRQGIRIGDGAIIGAGAVVVHDVAPGATVIGAPARPVR